MSNPVKNSLTKLHQKIFRSINKSLHEINESLVDINEKLDKNSAVTSNVERLLFLQTQEAKYATAPIIPISEREVATKLFNGQIIYLDPKDISVVPHILLERVWEREITEAWLSVIHNPDSVVFDIGANFGYYGMLAAQELSKDKGKVVLFEANPNLIPYIDKSLAVNWLKENTIVECLGVSDSKGTAQLTILENYIGSSSMNTLKELDSYANKKMRVEAESTVEVSTITIDEYCSTHNIKEINLMKIDIEGYEEKAYDGMRKIVGNSPNMILFIEFTKYAYKSPKKFYQALIDDFGRVYTIDQNGKFVKPKNNSFEAMIEPLNDLIFLVFSKKELNT